jgi:hypothetical protein
MPAHPGFNLHAIVLGLIAAYFFEKFHSLIPGIILHYGINSDSDLNFWLFRFIGLESKNISLIGTLVCYFGFCFFYWLTFKKTFKVEANF